MFCVRFNTKLFVRALALPQDYESFWHCFGEHRRTIHFPYQVEAGQHELIVRRSPSEAKAADTTAKTQHLRLADAQHGSFDVTEAEADCLRPKLIDATATSPKSGCCERLKVRLRKTPHDGWTAVVDPSTRHTYYWNPKTQETSWLNPEFEAEAEPASEVMGAPKFAPPTATPTTVNPVASRLSRLASTLSAGLSMKIFNVVFLVSSPPPC